MSSGDPGSERPRELGEGIYYGLNRVLPKDVEVLSPQELRMRLDLEIGSLQRSN